MLIILYGPDTYRSRQKLNEIIGYYKKIHKSGLNLKFFEEKELDFEIFSNEFFSSSMFSEKKLYILKELLSNQTFKERFLKNLNKFINSENILLFYETKEIPQDDKIFKVIKKTKKTQFQKFNFLDRPSLKIWLKKEAEKQKIKIQPGAIMKLIDFLGNDTWCLSNELQKLFHFKGGAEIEAKDVKKLVKPETESDIFETINAVASKNKKTALELMHRHLEKGEHPLYLLSMIGFQFRNLLMVRELIEKKIPYYSMLKQTKMKPYLFKKTYEQALLFSLGELKKIYREIFQTDIKIKTGEGDPRTVFELLITRL